MSIYKFLLSSLIITLATYSWAQQSSPSILNIGLGYGYEMPVGDLSDRFGNNFEIGYKVDWVTPKNWIIGIDGGFKFGTDVKEDPLAIFRVSDGRLLGADHAWAETYFRKRGVFIGVALGKIFPLSGGRSGIRVHLTPGLMTHHIRLVDESSSLAQIDEDYRHGYDRLTRGLAMKQYVGYQHLSADKRVNFSIGIESTLGYTKQVRKYNFGETAIANTDNRFDGYIGIKATWFLPFYGDTVAEDIYY